MDAIPEGGAFPSLTIQGRSCLYWEHGRGPQLLGLGVSREAEALASEQGKPCQLGFISSCGLSLTHVRGASTKEQALRSTLDNVSPEGRGVQSV